MDTNKLMTTEPMTTDSLENSAEVGVDVQRLVRCGWGHRKSGKAAIIQYETANERIGWRYKGSKRVYESDKITFLRKFSSPNSPDEKPL